MIGLVAKKKKGNLFLRFWLILFFGRKKKIMFSERKGIWLFLFSKEKKRNLFLIFWLILFSERKKKGFFCFKNSVVSVSGKKTCLLVYEKGNPSTKYEEGF